MLANIATAYTILAKRYQAVPNSVLSFDLFNEPWKIDIMAFMEEYYTRHMSLSEFANYTGRSLATFKRDFAKMNDVTP